MNKQIKEEIKNIEKAIFWIRGSFLWDETREGIWYWSDVIKKLRRIQKHKKVANPKHKLL